MQDLQMYFPSPVLHIEQECIAIEYFLHLWRHLKINFELKFPSSVTNAWN